jgi:hypothetical protein
VAPMAQYSEEARATLEHEAKAQIFKDGVGAEQSPTYAAWAAEMILLASFVARANGRPFSKEVDDRLAAFGTYIAWLSDGNGRVPAIGDDDGGHVFAGLETMDDYYPASVALSVASFLGRRAFGAFPGKSNAVRDTVFGSPDPCRDAPEGLRSFEKGGYSVVRETRAGRRVRFVLDHGPLGYLSIAAHGHADANAVTLSLDDRPILVDPGTYLYHSCGKWRDWFRGTRAHNTLNVQGADQSIISGPFNWSHKARAWLEHSQAGKDWSLSGRHDGYVSRFGVEHRRTVSARADGVEFLDCLLPCNDRIPAEIVFQFAPDLDIEGEGFTRAIKGGNEVLALISFDTPGEIELHRGDPDESLGWVSARFGEKEPAPRLAWRGRIPRQGLHTALTWSL